MRIPLAAQVSWRDDIYNHRYAIGIWAALNLMDYLSTVAGLSGGAHEFNPFAANLSLPAMALLKVSLSALAITWLAAWRWLKFLKWVNLFLMLVVLSNIFDLIVRPVY